MNAVLKRINAYPDYFAGADGNIYSTRSGALRLLQKRIHRGYYHVTVQTPHALSRKVKEPVHKLILWAFVGLRPDGMVCRHLNGNALDNRIENICWGTPKENALDAIKHGTAVCLRHGEQSVAAKLTLQDVLAIRQQYAQGALQREIAADFGITQRHVSDIVRTKTWLSDLGGAV